MSAQGQALVDAAKDGDLREVSRLLIQPGVDKNYRDKWGSTALMLAAGQGHLEVVRTLLQAGALVNIQAKDGSTALNLAAAYGRVEAVRTLLQAGAVANIQANDGTTALIWAAARGHLEVVRTLLLAGANANLQDSSYGKRALDFAATEEIKQLLRNPPPPAPPAPTPAPPTPPPAVNAAKAEADRVKAEADRAAAAKAEADRAAAAVMAEAERVAAVKAEADRVAAEQAEQRREEELVRTVLSNGAPVSLPMALIRTWTENFSQELDRGAFGVVYKGLVTSARGGAAAVTPTNGSSKAACYIAVKNFNIDVVGAVVNGAGADTKDEKDTNPFIDSVMREIHVLSSFNHPNIIRLMGYSLPTREQCRDNNVSPTHACLVYEFASRGGLHKLLQDDRSAAELTWLYRIKVALGVAKGLAFMHNRDPGNPAYHRDIKAANIALTQDFVPKIIDCGLAKYIPEVKVVSIRSATGARFGTVGYMCPTYCKKANMLYDTKCEIYAFGILLLELISGHVQGTQEDNLEDLLSEDNLVRDERAGWPAADGPDPLPRLLALAAECVEPYPKRRSDMRSVSRELSAILQLRAPTALEGALMDSHSLLAAELEELRLHRDVTALGTTETQHECVVCMDCFPLSRGMLCNSGGQGKGHFFCDEDLSEMTLSQCGDMSFFVRRGCKIVCAMCAPGDPAAQSELQLAALVKHVSPAALGSFVEANKTAERQLEERRGQARQEKDCERHADEMQVLMERMLVDQAAKLEASVQRHRLRIINDILTLKCPWCEGAFVGFDDCYAVRHEAVGVNDNQGCGRYFCGWCLQKCEGSGPCHGHVRECNAAPPKYKGQFVGDDVEFLRVHAARRRDAVLQYLRLNVPDAAEEAKLREVLAADLRDLSIRL